MKRQETLDFKMGIARGYSLALSEMTVLLEAMAELHPETAEHTTELLAGLRAAMLERLTELAADAAAS